MARLIGRSNRTVHRLVMSGHLKPVKKFDGPNGAFLFAREDVDMLIEQQRAKAAA